MAEKLTVELNGFTELQQKLRDIPDDIRKRTGFQAVARVQQTTKREAIANVVTLGLIDTGALERGIALARIASGSPDVFMYDVGVRHGKRVSSKQGKGGDDPWYWWLHEFGFTDRGGHKVGPRPFITPAFAARMGDAPALMGSTLWKGILKFEAKGGGGSGE